MLDVVVGERIHELTGAGVMQSVITLKGASGRGSL